MSNMLQIMFLEYRQMFLLDYVNKKMNKNNKFEVIQDFFYYLCSLNST